MSYGLLYLQLLPELTIMQNFMLPLATLRDDGSSSFSFMHYSKPGVSYRVIILLLMISMLGLAVAMLIEMAQVKGIIERRFNNIMVFACLNFVIGFIWYLYDSGRKQALDLKDKNLELAKKDKQNRHILKRNEEDHLSSSGQSNAPGGALEETMPQTEEDAAVIAFDVQGSTELGHTVNHEFLKS